MPTFSYTIPFQYGAQVRKDHDNRILDYIDDRKLEKFQTPFDSPYPEITVDLKYLKVLCQETDDKNKGDINGQTALHAFCLYGSLRSVQILLETGSDQGCEDKAGYSIIHYCTIADREDILSFLHKNGSSITKGAIETCRTPLHIASMCGSARCVEYLLESGVQVDQLDNFGCSPLWLALYYGNDAICQLLFEKGAQLTATDRISFVFRTLEKCSEFGKVVLSSYVTTCFYRGVSCVWLNKLINGLSYDKTDLTHAFLLSLTSPAQQLIQHPFFKTYTSVTWRLIGRRQAVMNVVRHLLYSFMWTFHFMSDTGETFRGPGSGPKIAAYTLLLPYTCHMIYHTVSTIKSTYTKQLECLEFENSLVEREFKYVHPCMWNACHVLEREKMVLSVKHKHLYFGRVLAPKSLELCIILLSLIVLLLDLIMTAISETERKRPHLNVFYMVITSIVLVLVWANTFIKFKFFKEFGTFLISLQKLSNLLTKFAVMFLVFYIPVSCVFWKTIYEGNYKVTTNITFLDSCYKVYRMTYSDYTYSEGVALAIKDGYPSWWNVLTFYWITMGSLILLRVFGGMVYTVLSEPIEQRQFTALKQRLEFICEVLIAQSEVKQQEFSRHLELECNPFVKEIKQK